MFAVNVHSVLVQLQISNITSWCI